MRDFDSKPLPLDQADGLRRLFARKRVQMVPVVSNPHVAFGGVMLERLCAGFTELGLHVLVVDASERASAPSELAVMDLADAIEPLSAGVSYLAARGLAIRHVDATGSTAPFLTALTDAAPRAEVILVHAPATELARLFARSAELARRSGDESALVRPLLLADDRPASVTHAYAALKLLTQRAGLVVHDLMLAAAPNSPRAERIAIQLATCADDFLGAVLRDWVRLDPATDASEPPAEALRRWVRETLRVETAARASAASTPYYVDRPQRAEARWAMN
ncbi:MAG: flagellar biosynthesis protein [Proteobacteria bacterium]|nr:flagellar biosynthesis protein [Pseudomonadota bacterium]